MASRDLTFLEAIFMFKLNDAEMHQLYDLKISYSEIARRLSEKYQLNITAAKVSRWYSRKKYVPHFKPTAKKDINVEAIYNEYISGISIYSLSKTNNIAPDTLRIRLKKFKPDMIFRSCDDLSWRPNILNDKSALEKELQTKSRRQLAKELNVKASTVCAAAIRLGIIHQKIEAIDYKKLFELYLCKLMMPSAIAAELGYSYNTVLKQLRSNGFEIAKPGGIKKKSKHWQLNDRDWLFDNYINKQFSINQIKDTIGTTASNVLHHLRKHNIQIRARAEWYKLLKLHGHKGKLRDIDYDSEIERKFLKQLSDNVTVTRGPHLSVGKVHCDIDFDVNGVLYEIKPSSIFNDPAVARRRAIKQFKICEINKIRLVIWTPNGVWNPSITDDDIYYAISWKLFFDSPDECYQWLVSYGFKPPVYQDLDLASAIRNCNKCKVGDELNANYHNGEAIKIVTSFFPHYWKSSHKEYNSISKAWDYGNQSVLRAAIKEYWDQKTEVNIYGLLKFITKHYKDFATVSVFKPWIARYIYNKYLPNGGTVIDPSCGWGTRLLGTIGLPIKYIGYDINQNSISSHTKLAEFMGSSLVNAPEFYNADSSSVDFVDGDLLFTSPPYDDTEYYHGVNEFTPTYNIIDNIFKKFRKTIILNIPRRHTNMCVEIASKYGRKLSETLEMKTGSFMGRKNTFEPILVFIGER